METLAPIEAVDLEIATTCNLRCRFCVEAFDRTGRRGRTMRLDQWRAVSEANLRPPYNIVFSGFCEPLLHPQIEAFVAYEKNRGNRVNIGTNGLLLDAPVRNRLLELGVDRFSVSLQSLNADFYTLQTGGGELARVLENLAALQRAVRRDSLETDVAVNLALAKGSVGFVSDMLRWLGERGLGQLYLIRLMRHPENERPFWDAEHYPWEEYYALDLAEIRRVAEESGVRLMASDRRILDRVGCPFPDNGVAVNADFDVSVCGLALQHEEWVLGNLKTERLDDIRRSERWTAFRRAGAAGRYPPVCTEFCSCVFSPNAW